MLRRPSLPLYALHLNAVWTPAPQVTITGNYPDPAFVIEHCGATMPRLTTIDGHGDLINSTYPPALVPTVNIVRCRRNAAATGCAKTLL